MNYDAATSQYQFTDSADPDPIPPVPAGQLGGVVIDGGGGHDSLTVASSAPAAPVTLAADPSADGTTLDVWVDAGAALTDAAATATLGTLSLAAGASVVVAAAPTSAAPTAAAPTSGGSTSTTITVGTLPQEAAPTNLVAAPDDPGVVRLSWDWTGPNPADVTFDVYYKTDYDPTAVVTSNHRYAVQTSPASQTAGDETSDFDVAGLGPGGAYDFQVVAADTTGACSPSDPSNEAFAEASPNPPAAGSLQATPSYRFVALDWTPTGPLQTDWLTTPTRYTVQQWNYGTSVWNSLVTLRGNETTDVVDHLAPNTNYLFQVVASNRGGSTVVGQKQATTLLTLPAQPIFSKDETDFSPDRPAFFEDWKTPDPTNTDDFVIEGDVNEGGWEYITTIAKASNDPAYAYSWPVASQTGNFYKFRVVAVNASGRSDELPPATPTDFVNRRVSDTATESFWNQSDDGTATAPASPPSGYLVTRTSNDGETRTFYVPADPSAAGGPTDENGHLTDANVTPWVSSAYTVRAFDAAGDSGSAGAARVRNPSTLPPIHLTVTPTDAAHMHLQWDRLVDPTTHRLLYTDWTVLRQEVGVDPDYVVVGSAGDPNANDTSGVFTFDDTLPEGGVFRYRVAPAVLGTPPDDGYSDEADGITLGTVEPQRPVDPDDPQLGDLPATPAYTPADAGTPGLYQVTISETSDGDYADDGYALTGKNRVPGQPDVPLADALTATTEWVQADNANDAVAKAVTGTVDFTPNGSLDPDEAAGQPTEAAYQPFAQTFGQGGFLVTPSFVSATDPNTYTVGIDLDCDYQEGQVDWDDVHWTATAATNKSYDFFFDGTNNDGDNTPPPNPINPAQNPTNVYNMYLEDKAVNPQVDYLKGVVQTDFPSSNDVPKNVLIIISSAYNKLLGFLNQDPDADIDIVGFSRGSAEAVDFANTVESAIRAGSFVNKYHVSGIPASITVDPAKLKIRFLGLYDLVTSVGGIGKNVGLNEGIPAGIGLVTQAISLDEERPEFEFTDLKQLLQGTTHSPLTQLGFRGTHADVGGGWGTDDVSAITLAWMNGEAGLSGWTTPGANVAAAKQNGTMPATYKTAVDYAKIPVHDSSLNWHPVAPWIPSERHYRNFPKWAPGLDCWQPDPANPQNWKGVPVPYGSTLLANRQYWDPLLAQFRTAKDQGENGATLSQT